MDAQRTAHLKGKKLPEAGHVHSHGVSANMGGKLVAALALTSLFVIGEFIAGMISNSLALVSDAGTTSRTLWQLALACGP